MPSIDAGRRREAAAKFNNATNSIFFLATELKDFMILIFYLNLNVMYMVVLKNLILKSKIL